MRSLRCLVVAHPVATFFVIACGISWSLWIPIVVAGGGSSEFASLSIAVGAFGPALAAVAVTAYAEGTAAVAPLIGRLVRPSRALRWYAIALIGPIAIDAAALFVAALLGTPLSSGWKPPVGAFVAGFVTVFLIGGGQEELGWRGFAQVRLQETYGPVPSALVVGVAWAAWHLPAFAMPAFTGGVPPFGYFAPWVVSESVLIAVVFNASGGSLLPAMVWHAAMNNAAIFLPVDSGSVARDPHLQLVLLAVTWIAVTVVVVFSRLRRGPIATVEQRWLATRW